MLHLSRLCPQSSLALDPILAILGYPGLLRISKDSILDGFLTFLKARQHVYVF